MSFNFVIVVNDTPVFDTEFGARSPMHSKDSASASSQEEQGYLHQLMLSSGLDAVQTQLWTTNSMNLKIVDKYNDWNVSAYVTGGQCRLLLLHDIKNDDGIKNFFQEAHELYVKVMLNPFYELGQPITSTIFAQKIHAAAKRHL